MARSALIKFLVFVSGILLFHSVKAQENFKKQEDSLRALMKRAAPAEKYRLMLELEGLSTLPKYSGEFPRLFAEFTAIARHDGNDSLLAGFYHQAGVRQYYLHNYILAAGYMDTAISIAAKKNLDLQLMKGYMTRGAFFYTSRDFYKSLSDYMRSEKLMLKHKSPAIGGLYSNIAMIYSEMGELNLAESYELKAIPFVKLANDVEGLAKVYNNLGLLNKKRKNYPAADSVFTIGIAYVRKNHLDRDLQDMLFNESAVKIHLGKAEEALQLRLELRDLVLRANDINWLKMVTIHIARNYSILGNKAKASEYMKAAEAINWNEDAFPEMTEYYETLGDLQFAAGDFKGAAKSFSYTADAYSDANGGEELLSLEKLRYDTQRQQDSLTFAKQQEIDKLNSEKMQQETEHRLSRQKIFTTIIIIVLLVIGFFSVTLFRANRLKEAANAELKEQKRLVSEKNTEITDSIQYSLRIQQSLLPSNRKLTHYLPQYFLIYYPKDIVSGDFYWLHDLGDSEMLLAVADCTGHGVPGAIMSALSIQQLNGIARTVKEPSKILQRLNKKLKENLKQEEDGISKDGLDICLCRINLQTKKIIYAGANRNLWIFDKNGLKLEIKATKAGIAGHTIDSQEYEQHEITPAESDFFLMSSDGFADQFGGEKMKKITTRQFKTWICSSPAAFGEKGNFLSEKFQAWKKNTEQIDDVCVLAFSPFPGERE